MRFLNIIALSVILSVGCKSTSKTAVVKNEVLPAVELSGEDKLKFDYLFQQALKSRLAGNLDGALKLYDECRKIDPSSGVALYEIGSIFMTKGNFEGARLFLEGAVKNSPDNIYYKEGLVSACLKQNDIVGAIRVYEDIVLKDPHNEEKLFMLGRMYDANKQYDKAIDAFNRLENIIGVSEYISRMKSGFYLYLGNKKKALLELDALKKKYPNHPTSFLSYGDYYNAVNLPAKALENYLIADKLAGYHSVYLGNVASMYMQLNDSANFKNTMVDALTSKSISGEEKISIILLFMGEKNWMPFIQPYIKDFFRILEDSEPKDASVLGYLAFNYEALGDMKKGMELVARAMDEMLDDERLWVSGLRMLISNQDFQKVAYYGEHGNKFFPDNIVLKYFYGSALQQLKREHEAVKIFIEADSLIDGKDPMKATLLTSLGDSYFSLGEADKAFKAYDEAVSINPNEPITLNNYAYYLSVKNRDLDKAEQMSQKCIQLEPANPTYLDTHAWVLFKLGRYFEAKFIMERALDYEKEPSSVLLDHYGDILFFNQDIDGAVEFWQKALIQEPDSEIIKRKVDSRKYFSGDEKK